MANEADAIKQAANSGNGKEAGDGTNKYAKVLQVAVKFTGLDGFSKEIMKSIDGVKNLITKQFTDIFTDAFSNALKETNNILAFSKLSNATTRDYALSYGFSSSEAYGYNQAMNMLGFTSEEDLYYANTQELKQFREAFDKYSEQYTKLYDSGFFTDLQEYQVEMKELKQDLILELVQFFVDNKDIIKTVMSAILTIAKTVLNLLSFLVGSNSNVASTSDILNNYSQIQRNKNVTLNNTFNGIGKQDEAFAQNVGAMSYEQVIRALGGGR